jgi:phytoene synthase
MTDETAPADLVRRLDRDRFVLAMLMPPERRAAVLALFAANVEVARVAALVSDPMVGALRLQYWRDIVTALDPAGAARGHPVAEALATEALPRLDAADRDRLLDSLQARLDDLAPDPPPDVAAVDALARRTAGTLALLNARLLGVAPGPGDAAALAVGTAWGLLGLARATPGLLAQGRPRLPLAVTGPNPDRAGLRAGVAALVEAAEAHLRGAHLAAARRAVPRPDPRLRPVLAQAAHGWHLIRAFRRADHDPGHRAVTTLRAPVARLVLARAGLGGR